MLSTGGKSYAKYENVVTTFKSYTEHDTLDVTNKISAGLKTVTKLGPTACAGGGLGVIVLWCENPVELASELNLIQLEQTTQLGTSDNTVEESNSFSTSWSFQTSEDPWTAGAMSDVFVVPNLNVFFEDVYEVLWDNDSCKAATITLSEDEDARGDTPFPSQLLFSIEEGEQALSFYSRYHMTFVKIPELQASFDRQEKLIGRMKANEPICCSVAKVNGLCPPGKSDKVCAPSDIIEEEADRDVFKSGLKGWQEALDIETAELEDKDSIVNWFDTVGSQGMHTRSETSLDEDNPLLESIVESGLAPPDLIDGAKQRDSPYAEQTEESAKSKLEAAQRIQIAGGGTLYEMKLKKEREDKSLACAAGCKLSSSTNLQLPGLNALLVKAFGNGVEANFSPFDFTIEYTHEYSKEVTNTKATEISFVLGDDDPGDEFVIDLSYDTRYGSVIFKTVAGRSKCPWEAGKLCCKYVDRMHYVLFLFETCGTKLCNPYALP